MKIIVLITLTVFTFLIGNAQLEKMKYIIKGYEDEVNEVTYVAGVTEDSKLAVVKLDGNFNVIKEFTSSSTVEENAIVWAGLRPPLLSLKVKEGQEFFFNEDLEEGLLKIDGREFTSHHTFQKENLIFKYKYQNDDNGEERLKRLEKNNKKGIYEENWYNDLKDFYSHKGQLELICYERNGSELKEIWTGNINEIGIENFEILEVNDEYVYCYSKTEINNYKLIKFDISSRKVVKTKVINANFDNEKTKSEIKFDKYRNLFYAGFVESDGIKNKDQYATIKVFSYDDMLEEVGSVIEKKAVFPKEDCKFKSVKGTFENSRPSDNKTVFWISQSGVNIQVTHSTTLEMGPVNQEGYYARPIGITDFTLTNGEVTSNFYNKDFLETYYFRESEIRPSPFVVNNFRNKIMHKGKPIFVIANVHASNKLIRKNVPPVQIEYTDLKNKKVLQKSEKFVLGWFDRYALRGENRFIESDPNKSYYFVSEDETKVLWIYASEFEEAAPHTTLKFNFAIDTFE